ncbi:MAG: sodium:alanine symporter family protein [Synergistes sp.]|nr:sodium:alanine symporter family protein [Synergistes sp.]
MDLVWEINGIVNGIVWGPWMLTLLVGTGVWLTFALRFPQVRYFGMMFKEVLGHIKGKKDEAGSISAFAAMATALAATVGTGNIAGVATAMHVGGPGALVWMLISAIFGMATKFSEVALAVRYRELGRDGNYRGGTMYILEKALRMKWLALLFAVLTILASFGIGNMVQSNSTAEGIAMGFGVPEVVTGIVVAILIGFVISGSIKRIAVVTVYLVPFMAILYIFGAIAVIIVYIDAVPQAIYSAFYGAFCDPMALPGALAGWSVKVAITRGISRGVFSNEAGLGSAPMAHCTARTDHPVRQGLYGLFEVFADTIIICNLTAITILATGVLTSAPELNGAKLSLAAFQLVLGKGGVMILAVALSLFAFSTILGWYWYAETAIVYIVGSPKKAVLYPFRVFWMILIVLGAWGGSGALASLWDLSDTLNGLMAVPNLIGLLLLTKELRFLVKDFDSRVKDGNLPRYL